MSELADLGSPQAVALLHSLWGNADIATQVKLIDAFAAQVWEEAAQVVEATPVSQAAAQQFILGAEDMRWLNAAALRAKAGTG